MRGLPSYHSRQRKHSCIGFRAWVSTKEKSIWQCKCNLVRTVAPGKAYRTKFSVCKCVCKCICKCVCTNNGRSLGLAYTQTMRPLNIRLLNNEAPQHMITPAQTNTIRILQHIQPSLRRVHLYVEHISRMLMYSCALRAHMYSKH